MPVRKKLVNTTSAQKRLAGKEQPYTDLCPLRQIGIGLFFVLERQTRRRMSQTDFTTAELALHYRGLGAGPPTSKVQKVKRLPSLPQLVMRMIAMNYENVATHSVSV